MPKSTTHEHAHHHEGADGTHVMPDSTVMTVAHHDHSARARPAAPGDQSEVEYTCPMHPQVRQRGPGQCPLCGMSLEPVLATAEQAESPELRDMTKRLWIGTALTLLVFPGLRRSPSRHLLQTLCTAKA